MEFIPLKVLRDSGVKFTEVKTRVFQDEMTIPGSTPKPRLATPRIAKDAEALVEHFKNFERSGYNVFLYEGTEEEKAKANADASEGARGFVAVFGATSDTPRISQ